MTKLRAIYYDVDEYEVDPAVYDFAPDNEILKIEQEVLGKTHVVKLQRKVEKQFTNEHLKQLNATRGFLNVMCSWLEPEQVADKEIRSRVALVQHLLEEIWEKLDE